MRSARRREASSGSVDGRDDRGWGAWSHPFEASLDRLTRRIVETGSAGSGALLVGHLSLKERSSRHWGAILACCAAVLLAACHSEVEVPASEIRPVRAITVHKRDSAVPVILTGAFGLGMRRSGVSDRRADDRQTCQPGDSVRAGQLVARLEPQNEQNSCVRAAVSRPRGAADQCAHGSQSSGAARGSRSRVAERPIRPGGVPDSAVSG
jgi:hypothetical protein